MTLNTRVMLTSLMLAIGGVFGTPTSAQAQTTLAPVMLAPGMMSAPGIHPTAHGVFEGYYSHYRVHAPGDRIGMNGVGARFVWRPTATDYSMLIRPSRFALGLFGEYAPEQSKGFSVGHVGLQGDMNVFSTPLYGRVSPVLSLAAGVLWTNRNGPALDSREFSLADQSTTTFALAPSLGTRVGLWRQLGLRADVRDLVTFKDRTLHHPQIAAGLSLPF
jgi:hypothetical protein